MPTSGTAAARVFIVDDHAVIRSGLLSYLELVDDWRRSARRPTGRRP